jgi:beta-galactosidase/beta-glucuronidase
MGMAGRRFTMMVATIALVSAGSGWSAAEDARATLPLDGAWKFFPAFTEIAGSHRFMEEGLKSEDATAPKNPDQHYGWILPDFDDAAWWDIPVPGTWNNTFEDLETYEGQGWYRKTVEIPLDWKGKHINFHSGGANYRTVLYVNGIRVGAHEGGYTAFQFPIHDHLKYGETNTFALSVDNETNVNRVPMERFGWYQYGGLFRSVHLEAIELCHVEDVLVTTEALKAPAQVHLVVQCAGGDNGITLKTTITDTDGKVVAQVAQDSTLKGNRADVALKLNVSTPHLWSPEDPYLYQLVVELTDIESRRTDRWQRPIGIRSIELKNKQFRLNGKPYLIKGVNRHEDYEETGGTSTEALLRRDLQLIKDLGANAVRSHYPNSPRTYELFDEIGLLTVAEVPLYHWGRPGHSQANLDAAKHQLTEMVHQLRNHPSVAFWSVSNENRIRPWTDEEGERELAAMVAEGNQDLVDMAHALDPTRPVMEASNRWPEDVLFEKTDVSAINVYLHVPTPRAASMPEMETTLHENFEDLRSRYPDKPILVSEFGVWALHGLKTDYYPGELYQSALLSTLWKAFEKEENFIGGFVWVFADHDLHKKYISIYEMRIAYGLYNRDRQPKASVETMRALWKDTK